MPKAVVSLSQFKQIFPQGADYFRWFLGDGAACDEFKITTSLERVAAFFAQIHHESLGLTRREESFAYTPERLAKIFPFRFPTITLARTYAARGPEAIANLVYASRMGNGTESSGDGWRFRGRGFIQLTGRNNYADFAAAFGLPLTAEPELAAEPSIAARIAARFWDLRGCNEKADALNIRAVTRAINGGLNGLNERTAIWQRVRSILGLKELSEVS